MRKDFLWGAATSSHQIDGNNTHSDWWRWEQEGNIEGGVVSGKATDHWNRFKEDLRLAKDLGLNSYRFSIEWARIEPELGVWNREAIDWYQELLSECERLEIKPMATLLHFTVPQWFSDLGGFTSDQAADKFAGFTKKVAKQLGPRIPLWCTLNEPNSMIVGQYLGAFMPPAVWSPEMASKSARGLLESHVRAYDILHDSRIQRTGPWKNEKVLVGLANSMLDFHPLNPKSPVERWMTRVVRRYYNRSWPDAVTGRKQHFGVLGLVPYPRQVWGARGRVTIDFLGINYYTKAYICFGPQSKEAALFAKSRYFPLGFLFSKKGEPVSDVGWSIYPKGLGRMIRFMGRYRLPLHITENGIADADDSRRSEFIDSHLLEVRNAIAKGSDVRGYYHWSLLDNFEWVKGFDPRFGLCEVDYESFQRTPRKSFERYREIIAEENFRPF